MTVVGTPIAQYSEVECTLFDLKILRKSRILPTFDHITTNSQSKIGKICSFSLPKFNGGRDGCYVRQGSAVKYYYYIKYLFLYLMETNLYSQGSTKN